MVKQLKTSRKSSPKQHRVGSGDNKNVNTSQLGPKLEKDKAHSWQVKKIGQYIYYPIKVNKDGLVPPLQVKGLQGQWNVHENFSQT